MHLEPIGGDEYILKLCDGVLQPKEDTIIQVECNSTHIFCPDQVLRTKLRAIILRCLNKF